MLKHLVKKRVSAHIVEAVVLAMMLLTGLAVIIIFARAMGIDNPHPNIVIIELMLLQLIGILALIFISVKIWEQHVFKGYEHKKK